MKRLSITVACLVAALLPGTWLRLQAVSRTEAKQTAAWPTHERGFGVTYEEAKNDAVKHLLRQLETILREHEPPLSAWQPTPGYVMDHLLLGEGDPGPDFVVENIKPMKTWIYDVKGLDWPALETLDRQARRASRISVGMRLFGMLGLVLVVITISARRARR